MLICRRFSEVLHRLVYSVDIHISNSKPEPQSLQQVDRIQEVQDDEGNIQENCFVGFQLLRIGINKSFCPNQIPFSLSPYNSPLKMIPPSLQSLSKNNVYKTNPETKTTNKLKIELAIKHSMIKPPKILFKFSNLYRIHY